MASTIPDPLPGSHSSSGAARPAPERAGAIEAHGIDHIPDAERHGRPRDLFALWAAANVNCLSLVVGGALVLMGPASGRPSP
ncbi:hypothetical protein ABZ667_31800 [Streptomyces lavendulae]